MSPMVSPKLLLQSWELWSDWTLDIRPSLFPSLPVYLSSVPAASCHLCSLRTWKLCKGTYWECEKEDKSRKKPNISRSRIGQDPWLWSEARMKIGIKDRTRGTNQSILRSKTRNGIWQARKSGAKNLMECCDFFFYLKLCRLIWTFRSPTIHWGFSFTELTDIHLPSNSDAAMCAPCSEARNEMKTT